MSEYEEMNIENKRKEIGKKEKLENVVKGEFW